MSDEEFDVCTCPRTTRERTDEVVFEDEERVAYKCATCGDGIVARKVSDDQMIDLNEEL